jgi:hypothetical protein
MGQTLPQLALCIRRSHWVLTAGGTGSDSKPVIKELLVSCFDGADNPEDAFLRDFLQGQHWRDDQPEGVFLVCILVCIPAPAPSSTH